MKSLLNEKEAFREFFPEELQKFREDAEKKGKGIEYISRPNNNSESEPNLRQLQNADDEDDLTVYGLLMTYVDDIDCSSRTSHVGCPEQDSINMDYVSSWASI